MKNILKISGAILALSMILGVVSVAADSQTPVNAINVSFAPITTAISYNYDFLTGLVTPGTAIATVQSTGNIMQTRVSDPSPPDMRHGATFFGTGQPVNFQGDEVVYEQSVCQPSLATCFSPGGTFTFGGFVTRSTTGLTLGQLTELASLYYIQSPSCVGGGSPRFQIDMSNGASINVYFGTSPNFQDCTPSNVWQPACPTAQCGPTNNMASDTAGLRWDTSQVCTGTFYNNYSGAIRCADGFGLTFSDISIITDGGWFGTNAGTSTGQTFYFQQIHLNQQTRFP